MRIRVRLTLYAMAVATAGMLLFGVVLSTLARGGMAEDQDLALGRLADGMAQAIVECRSGRAHGPRAPGPARPIA